MCCCLLTRIIRTYLPSAYRLISQICSSPYPSFSFLQKRIRSGKCWCRGRSKRRCIWHRRGRSKRRCIWQRGRRCCRTPPFPFLPSNSNMVSLLARMNTLVRSSNDSLGSLPDSGVQYRRFQPIFIVMRQHAYYDASVYIGRGSGWQRKWVVLG